MKAGRPRFAMGMRHGSSHDRSERRPREVSWMIGMAAAGIGFGGAWIAFDSERSNVDRILGAAGAAAGAYLLLGALEII